MRRLFVVILPVSGWGLPQGRGTGSGGIGTDVIPLASSVGTCLTVGVNRRDFSWPPEVKTELDELQDCHGR